MPLLNIFKISLFIIVLCENIILARTITKIINETDTYITIKIVKSIKTKADLASNYLFLGLPKNNYPKTEIISTKKIKSTLEYTKSGDNYFEWTNIQKHQNLYVATLKINPTFDKNNIPEEIILKIYYPESQKIFRNANPNEKMLLSEKIINWNSAKNWFHKNQSRQRETSLQYQGEWLSFEIFTDGVKKISFNKLKESYDQLSSIDPRSLMLFSSPEFGRARKYETNIPIPENLEEIPIIIYGEDDGAFDYNDKIIFYGQGPSGFDYDGSDVKWSQNLYFNSSKYWIFIPLDNSLRGKRIPFASDPSQIDISLDYGISYHHNEVDLINPDLSGLRWYGPQVQSGSTQIITTPTPNGKNEVDCYIELKMRGYSLSGSSSTFHSIELHANSINDNKIGSTSSWTGNGLRTIAGPISGTDLNSNGNNFFISNLSSDNNSSPLIDFFTMKYGRKLVFNDKQLDFFSPVENTSLRFNFHDELPENVNIFDISNSRSPKRISIKDQLYIEVASPTNKPGRYVVFNQNDIDSISSFVKEEQNNFSTLRNYNIRADYIIIGPDIYRDLATPLIELRSPAIYASLEDIYQEFSGGNIDPMAIRTFVQWTQENWISPSPIHLLLLGDSGYDYRNINGLSAIVVPTIQVQSFISYPSDDRLTTIYGNLPELSIGRFPAKNISQVESFVDKIIFIETNNILGTWRQKLTLIADDPARPEPNHGGIATGKSHTLNSETLSDIIPSIIDVEKIYMLEYPEVSDASAYGVTKPAATEALFNSIRNGTAIINYIGHGSAFQLAQEKLLYLNRGDLESIKTNGRMPLWIVGTCSFGHFDDPLAESFGEELIRYPMDAASAVISTCRPITVTGNERYTQDIFENLFNENGISSLPIGICLQSIKNGSTESEYFHLFGDPALKIPMAKNRINNITIEAETLKTLSTAEINFNHELAASNASGVVLIKDANRSVTRSYNIASTTQTLSYDLPGATLFRGNFNLSEGYNSVDIRIPQDISYSQNSSKILIYLINEGVENISEINPIYLVGGDGTMDSNGPLINFKSSNGRIFKSGDHKSPQEKIIAEITDPLGINLTKELGHSIIIKNLDNNQSIDITDDFFYDNNSITTGRIDLENYFSTGVNYSLIAWDNANNPSEQEIRLFSSNDENLRLYNVYNFPNPFISDTKFTFELSLEADVAIDIYTLGGRKIKNFIYKLYQPGFHTIEWDGKNEYGKLLSNGVYLYKIKAKNNNSKTHKIGKIAIYR